MVTISDAVPKTPEPQVGHSTDTEDSKLCWKNILVLKHLSQ